MNKNIKIKNQKGLAPLAMIVVIGLAALATYGIYNYTGIKTPEFFKSDQKDSTKSTTTEEVTVGDTSISVEDTDDASNDTDSRGSSEPEQPVEINFSTGGMVFDENRKTGVKEWTFLYDVPGRLAIDVKLIFTDQSMCTLDGPEEVCDMTTFVWEDYANDTYFDLEGHKEGNEVTVAKLILHRMTY